MKRKRQSDLWLYRYIGGNMWLPILRHLKAYLEAKNVADTVRIGGYALQEIKPISGGKGQVQLVRIQEMPVDSKSLIEDVRIIFRIDAFIVAEQNRLEVGYEALYALENRIQEALVDYENETDYINADIQVLDVAIRSVRGTVAEIRPRIGASIEVEMIVYKG